MGRRLINRQYKLGSRAPSMQTITGDSGIANLSPYLTINSTTVAPTFVYHGNDATASTFPAQWGEALPIAGTGTAPSLNQPAYGNGDNDSMVVGSADVNYTSLSSSYADSATDDIVLELVGFWDGTADFKTILAKKSSSSAGYGIQFTPTGAISLIASDGTNNAISTSTDTIQAGTFFHYIGFIDKSGSICGYLNSAQTPVVSAGAVGSMTTTSGLSLFAFTGSSNRSQSGIVLVSMWQGALWLDTHLQAAVALERFQKWSGIYPTKASGTAAPTYSRDCSAYATKWNGTSYNLINCSAGLPRVDYVLDDSGTPFKGMLIEPQATNLFTYSNDFETGWSKANCTINTAETEGTPANEVYYQGIVADNTGGSTENLIALSVSTAAGNNCFSVIVKKADKDWVRIGDRTNGNYRYFDIANATPGTIDGTLEDSGIVDMGNGNSLVWIVSLCSSGTTNFGVYAAEADGDRLFDGDGSTIDTYVAFAQVELGNKPTSRIYTAGASATRLADSLQYNGDNVTAGQGTVKAEMLVDAHTPAAELSIAALSDGGSSDEMVRSYVDAGTQVPIFNAVDSTVAQWTITGSTDVIDGDIHTVKLPYESNDAKQYVDNAVDGTPDTSCTVPTGIDEIDIGQDTSSANQINGRIRNFRIYGFASSDV